MPQHSNPTSECRNRMSTENRPFELLIFDWDGTVMDSTATIVACAQQAARDVGLEPPPAQAIRETIGLSLADSMTRLYPEGVAKTRDRLVDRYRHHWISGFRDELTLFAEARQTLEALREQDYLLAVATGKSRAGLSFDLQSTGLGKLFHATRTADETRSKPNPQMLFELFDELGALPKNALMIGDTTYDLDMARNAGCRSVGLLCGSHSERDLTGSAPLTCLPEIHHLPDWLGSYSNQSREAERG